VKREITFTIPGAPQGKARARAGNGHHYTPAKTAAYENLIAGKARDAMGNQPPTEDAVILYAIAYYPIANSWSKRKQRAALSGDLPCTSKPDGDNVLKAILDACNGVVYRDDRQVTDMRLEKRYSAIPGVTVTFMPRLHDSTSPDPSNVVWRDAVIARTRAA